MKINTVNFTGAPRGVKKASTAVALAAASILPMACADGAGKLVSSEPVRDTVATVVKDTIRKNIDTAKDFVANLYMVKEGRLSVLNVTSKPTGYTAGILSTEKQVAARTLASDSIQMKKYYYSDPSAIESSILQTTDTTSNGTRKFLSEVIGKNLYPEQLNENSYQIPCLRFEKTTDSAWVEMNKAIQDKEAKIRVVVPKDSLTPEFYSRLGNGSQEERIIRVKCTE